MCGFVGTLTARTGSRLSHRGPDGSGSVSEILPWAHISLEMTRLSVVDRSDIHVPFDFRESCGVLLAFNGEIFNHHALREELSDGHPWQTQCDAEVVARGWRKWGPDILQHLNGMFGFCLVDVQKSVVFLARDRAGEKPLYYTALGSGLAFASEIKALPIRLEEGPCLELDALEADCLSTTPFKGVKCLGPGRYLYLDDVEDLHSPQPAGWWALPDLVDEDSISWLEAVDNVHALLVDAIKLRATCDVPVAVQLSGGLDSAIIQAVIQSDRLYCVTFPEDSIDNLTVAKEAAAGRAVVPVTFGLADLERALSDIVYHLDTPATWTAVCQWFMDKQIAKDGAVVVLSGEGADELFGGYSRYRILWWLQQLGRDPHLTAYAPLRQALLGESSEILAKTLNRGGPETFNHALRLVRMFGGDGDLCQRMARIDFDVTLPILLRMADRMAAAFSLENRSPFLDYRLMELGARIPTKWKITEDENKAVLRAVARRLGVPAAIINEKTKKGLFLPWAKWHGAENTWNRSSFATVMKNAWRQRFFGGP